jgi:sec-independent protein translocase protein TatA
MGLDNPIHLAFLLMILLLVFGAKRLPEMGRSLGSGMRGFKDALSGEQHDGAADHGTVATHIAAQPAAGLAPVAQDVAAQPAAGLVPVAQDVAEQPGAAGLAPLTPHVACQPGLVAGLVPVAGGAGEQPALAQSAAGRAVA